MRSKSIDLMNNIIEFIDKEYSENGRTPTMKEIADNFKITKGSVSNYIKAMENRGLIENRGGSRGIMTKTMQKKMNILQLPIVGTVACGNMMFAEQNIRGYFSISSEILGKGDFYVLETSGDSMINAGVNDGDYVIIRIQETAEEGQIVVANVGEEATLKRYYRDAKRKQIRLHPENDAMQDMYFDNVKIQGIAVKVLKDLI